jgi:GDPmannose 4,6-dehydratase
MKNNSALIFGITGQDGSYLSKLLLSKNFKVFGTTRKLKKKYPNFEKLKLNNSKIKIFSLTKTSEGKITKIINKINCTHIFYLSGISSVAVSHIYRKKTLLVNTAGLVDILESCRKIKRKIKIYNASSSECYGNQENKKINELTKFKPGSPYALSKVINYHITKNYRDNLGMWIANGISFNHDSPLRPNNFVFKKIINGIKKIENKKIKYLELGNLNISRDWGWAPEHIKYIYKIIMKKNPSDYVIGTGTKTKLKVILKKIFKIKKLSLKKNLKINKKYFRPNDIISNCANIKKLKKDFNDYPNTNIDTIIEKFLKNSYN